MTVDAKATGLRWISHPEDTECVCGDPIPAHHKHACSRTFGLCRRCVKASGVKVYGPMQKQPTPKERDPVTATRSYRTVVEFDSSCDKCDRVIPEGRTFAFRFEPKLVLCMRCADAEGVQLRDSQHYRELLDQEEREREQ